MRRETDVLGGYSYNAEQAVNALYGSYVRIYQDLTTRKYYLVPEGGKNLLIVDEPGLVEVAKSVSYSAFFREHPIA